MARFPKKRLKRPMPPGWVITAEALAAAVLIHIALFALAGYQPERRTAVAPTGPGVTLLTREGASAEEWKKLTGWIAVHDPSQISRADSPSGYPALLDNRRERATAALRSDGFRPKPPLPVLPGYVPLAAVAAESGTAAFGGASAEPEFRTPAPIRTPVVRDGDGAPVRLDHLTVPAAERPAERPTVVTVRGTPGFLRQHLTESSGVPALDLAAMEAVAANRFDAPKTVIVYWPETTPAAGEGGGEP